MKKKIEIRLQLLTTKHIKKKYINWLHDYDVVKYTEQRFGKHSVSSVVSFIKSKEKTKNEFIYGIFLIDKKNQKKKHVGNITLGPINFRHKFADVGYFIGEKQYWSKGIATEAIRKVIKIAKNKFKLKKLVAGFYEMNIASKKALVKNNFKLEGVLKAQIIYNNERCNYNLYGLKL